MQTVELFQAAFIKMQQAAVYVMPLQLTPEAEAKLRALAECLSFDNESAAVNELFYQFILNQQPDKRRMIMAVYEMNLKGAGG